MTKSQALFEFFSGFGLDAYPQNAVPETETFPYLSYDNTLGNYGDIVSITVRLWYYTESEAVPNAKAEEIAEAIGLGGVLLSYDGGTIWIRRGNPWCTSSNDEDNSSIKLRQINIDAEFN